jgi:hypothetical protein
MGERLEVLGFNSSTQAGTSTPRAPGASLSYLGYVDEPTSARYDFEHEDSEASSIFGDFDESLLGTTASRMDDAPNHHDRSRIQAERPESLLGRERRFQWRWGSGQSSFTSQSAYAQNGVLRLSDNNDGL